jgi:succinate dehydrogenase/fumarate reductase-like Fe-S protein
MSDESKGIVKAKIFRYNPDVDDAPHFETYSVPFTESARAMSAEANQLVEYYNKTKEKKKEKKWWCRDVEIQGLPQMRR